LTLRQQKFIHNYLLTSNATKSAILAGYSPKTAYSIGNENLKKPEIKKALAKKMSKILNETEVKEGISAKTGSTNEAIALRAYELMGRTYAMFIDKTINENHNYDAVELDKIRDKALKEAEDSLKSLISANSETQPGVEIEPKTEPEPEIKG
jgi:hypothetical protein